MSLTKEDLQAIRGIVQEELEPVRADLDELKEESKITRHSVNMLLKWAEKTDRTVNVGLYDE